MASFLTGPSGQAPGYSPASDGIGPVPDFSLDITTESFLEAPADSGEKNIDPEDSPVRTIPQPSFPKVSPPLLTPDPELCLTPDKPDRPPVVRVEKNKHVRFEMPTSESETSVKTLSSFGSGVSGETDENKENLSSDSTPDEGSKVYSYIQKQTKNNPEFKKCVDDHENVIEKEAGVHIFAKLKSKNANSQKANSSRAPEPRIVERGCDEAPVPRKPFSQESAKVYFPRALPKVTQPGVVTAEEHMFQRPEFNNTLKVNQEMKQLKTASLNVVKAVEEKLEASPNTRTQFKEKVTVRVNPMKPLFQSLESPDVERVDDIVKQVEIQRKSMIKGPNLESTRIQDSRFPDPNIMDMFMPNLQVETWSNNIDSLPKFTEPIQTAPENTAFELYRHLRIWEDLP